MTVKGIDVSSYQGATPDLSGLDFVFIKVTEGLSYVSPVWVAQRQAARNHGLVTGFYHYPHVANSPAAEADHFLSQINLTAGDVLCLDWEWYGQSVTDQQARDYKDAWLAYVKAKAPGHKVGIYSDTGNWKNVDTNSNCGDFLWIADYTTAGQPRVQHAWTFHQHSDSPLDEDVANFATAADLKAWASASNPEPKPSGTPQWLKLLEHVMAVPEQVYETWTSTAGWNNITQFGKEYGEDGASWCVIFNWDMFHDLGLDGVVPKTDNVDNFTSWAKARGQWSLYPSVGSWVNFDNGGHTEIVVGFDDQRVYTKGGNSIQTGAQDRGQGNGVWSHDELRLATRVVGYFAPHFPDGVCPPTADPHDPRGGVAVASYTPPEDDMTPAQAQQLADLHDMLTSIGSLTEKDPKGQQVFHGAGYYLAHIHFDALKIVAQEAAQTAAITAMATALGKVDEAIDVPALVTQVQQAVSQGVTKALNGITIDVNATSTTS